MRACVAVCVCSVSRCFVYDHKRQCLMVPAAVLWCVHGAAVCVVMRTQHRAYRREQQCADAWVSLCVAVRCCLLQCVVCASSMQQSPRRSGAVGGGSRTAVVAMMRRRLRSSCGVVS